MPPHILLRDLILLMFNVMATQSLTEWDFISHPTAHIGEQCPVFLSGMPHRIFSVRVSLVPTSLEVLCGAYHSTRAS